MSEQNKDLEEMVSRSIQLRLENKRLREEIQILKGKRMCPNTHQDLYIKIQGGLFELLVSGKKVMIEQADGSRLHFALEDVKWDQMLRAICKAQALEKLK